MIELINILNYTDNIKRTIWMLQKWFTNESCCHFRERITDIIYNCFFIELIDILNDSDYCQNYNLQWNWTESLKYVVEKSEWSGEWSMSFGLRSYIEHISCTSFCLRSSIEHISCISGELSNLERWHEQTPLFSNLRKLWSRKPCRRLTFKLCSNEVSLTLVK